MSFILEWNGYKIIYAGDTAPNKRFMEHAHDADLLFYECMLTPGQLMEYYGQPARLESIEADEVAIQQFLRRQQGPEALSAPC